MPGSSCQGLLGCDQRTEFTTMPYQCQSCHAYSKKWSGQCPDCASWNTLLEVAEIAHTSPGSPRKTKQANPLPLLQLSTIRQENIQRMPTGSHEFDRVLGGGLVPGSVILIGGDPGIGKSTLLGQVTGYLATQHKTLYVSGEESAAQIADRLRRLGVQGDDLPLLTAIDCEAIIATLADHQSQIVVIDSIQTLSSTSLQSAAGSVAQVRACAQQLIQYAKNHNTCIILVGHVTKEGQIAGPKVLEHMVDTVLYLEGQKDERYRLLRSVKNRYGALHELGVMAMSEQGMRDVSNPSALFITPKAFQAPGSAVTVLWEGSRPLLVEVQGLVDKVNGRERRQVCLGYDNTRLSMLLAILSRHGRCPLHQHDVFINVVGGLKVQETSIDLALLATLLSSAQSALLPDGLAIFGEVGLSGEIRPIHHGLERIREAYKHGVRQIILPARNCPQRQTEIPDGCQLHPLHHVSELQSTLEKICRTQ